MLLFVVAVRGRSGLHRALDLRNLPVRICTANYRRIALHFICCCRLESDSSSSKHVRAAFSNWLARMVSCQSPSHRDCVGSVRFLQTHPRLGWAFGLGNQSALRLFKRRSHSSWVLLKSWTRVQSSGISAWHTFYRALVVFVDGPAASILGKDNFWDLLRRGHSFVMSPRRPSFRSSMEWACRGNDSSVCSISYVSPRRSYRWLRRFSAQRCLSCRSRLSHPFFGER